MKRKETMMAEKKYPLVKGANGPDDKGKGTETRPAKIPVSKTGAK